jgi:acyl carrier protein
MTDQELLAGVTEAIRSTLKLGGEQILPGTRLIADLGTESLDLLDISSELEKVVDIEVNFRRLFDDRRAQPGVAADDITVQELADYLKEEIQKMNSAVAAV